ncbi:MAG: UDP-3-O-(3-hydroxymyristoyl)glucosamine N-acyltransferase [Thermoanaerobaculia bacterium]
MTTFSVAEIAARTGGRVSGDGTRRVRAVKPLETAGPEDLAFLADAHAQKVAPASAAGVLLAKSAAAFPGRTVIEVDDPALAVAEVIGLFHPRRKARPGVHPTAVIGAGASIHAEAEIGPYAIVGDGTRVGAGAIVEAHAAVGKECVVGDGAWVHPHVVLYDRTVLGARVEIHSGAVLGADGFGYAKGPAGLVKVPQVGGVVVEDDVEIGANSCIDRATLDATRVGAGTKIDDLVMIGHNCRIGRHDVLCGQAGLAGSTTIGDGVMIGGQVGVAGHLRVGDGVMAGAQTGIDGDVPDGEKVFGTPHMRHRDALRVFAELRRLPETARTVRALAARIRKKEDEDAR